MVAKACVAVHRANAGIRRTRSQKRKRSRKTVRQVFLELGPTMFRRAYRMSYEVFLRLAEKLRDPLTSLVYKNQDGPTSFYLLNGPIDYTVRLACAIRILAGGSFYDVAPLYGISAAEVRRGFWFVVEAVNKHPDFLIAFPTEENDQRRIAQGFKALSDAEFDCCAGAVDGLLLWIQRPTAAHSKKCRCDAGKFWCGRKHKYGLNLQGVCDHRGRFLDISIVFPASCSDCLAFEGSSLFTSLENGLLAEGLCLFGDNAYLNASYMATPYAAVSGGERDNYNFYFSQLRIRIECAFGMFVHRWAMLRAPMPVNLSVGKIVAIVMAMARLHNFCIDEGEPLATQRSAVDELSSELNGAVTLSATASGDVTVNELTGGGEHFRDVPRTVRRMGERRIESRGGQLPRERMCNIVAEKGLTRPAPMNSVFI